MIKKNYQKKMSHTSIPPLYDKELAT